MSKEKIDFLWKVLGRYDLYINSTNTKANFLIAFNTFLIGAHLANFSNNTNALEPFPTLKNLSILLIFVSFVSSIICLWFTFKVVNPFLTSNKKAGEYHSCIFFQDVSEYENAESFYQKFCKESDGDHFKDLAYQTHVLAKGTATKFNYLKKALIPIFVGQLPSIALLLIIRLIAFISDICSK